MQRFHLLMLGVLSGQRRVSKAIACRGCCQVRIITLGWNKQSNCKDRCCLVLFHVKG